MPGTLAIDAYYSITPSNMQKIVSVTFPLQEQKKTVEDKNHQPSDSNKGSCCFYGLLLSQLLLFSVVAEKFDLRLISQAQKYILLGNK